MLAYLDTLLSSSIAPGKRPESIDASPHPRTPAAAAMATTRWLVHVDPGPGSPAPVLLPAVFRRNAEALKNRRGVAAAALGPAAAEAVADRRRGLMPLAKELTDMQMTVAPPPGTSQEGFM